MSELKSYSIMVLLIKCELIQYFGVEFHVDSRGMGLTKHVVLHVYHTGP